MDFKQVSRCNSSLDLGRIWLDHSEYAITRSPITAPGVVVSAFWHVRPRDHVGLSQTYVRLTRVSDKASLIMRWSPITALRDLQSLRIVCVKT